MRDAGKGATADDFSIGTATSAVPDTSDLHDFAHKAAEIVRLVMRFAFL
ncbi:hypothetical protein [Brevundimonas vesicularis]|nr:hypothetical protein [Brevundimonas vesicularis]